MTLVRSVLFELMSVYLALSICDFEAPNQQGLAIIIALPQPKKKDGSISAWHYGSTCQNADEMVTRKASTASVVHCAPPSLLEKKISRGRRDISFV